MAVYGPPSDIIGNLTEWSVRRLARYDVFQVRGSSITGTFGVDFGAVGRVMAVHVLVNTTSSGFGLVVMADRNTGARWVDFSLTIPVTGTLVVPSLTTASTIILTGRAQIAGFGIGVGSDLTYSVWIER